VHNERTPSDSLAETPGCADPRGWAWYRRV